MAFEYKMIDTKLLEIYDALDATKSQAWNTYLEAANGSSNLASIKLSDLRVQLKKTNLLLAELDIHIKNLQTGIIQS